MASTSRPHAQVPIKDLQSMGQALWPSFNQLRQILEEGGAMGSVDHPVISGEIHLHLTLHRD